MTLSELQLRIQNAKTLDFGTVFSHAIELFKKVWVQGLVSLLLKAVLTVPFFIIMYIPLIAMGVLNPDTFNPENIEQGLQAESVIFIVLFYVVVFIFMFFAMIITFGMQSSFYRICKMKDYGEAGSDDHFFFFKKPHLPKTIKVSAAAAGIIMGAMLLCFFPIIYVMIPISFVSIIYAFNPELSVSDILKAAFGLGNKKWFFTFAIVLVSSFVAQTVGMIMCFVGIYVTASFSYLPAYFIYKEVIGFEDNDEIMKIGKN